MFLSPEDYRLKDGGSVALRSAVKEDAVQLLEVISGYISQNDGMLWEPGEYQKTEAEIGVWIGGMLANNCEILLLAEQDGQILGNIDFHIGGCRRIRHTGEFGMGVAPAHRGRGIGGLLLSRMIQWAKSIPQIERIELSTISNNIPALSLYQKFFFKEEGRRPCHIKYVDDSYADNLLMSFDLRDITPLEE